MMHQIRKLFGEGSLSFVALTFKIGATHFLWIRTMPYLSHSLMHLLNGAVERRAREKL